jgi:hypothetical protein
MARALAAACSVNAIATACTDPGVATHNLCAQLLALWRICAVFA